MGTEYIVNQGDSEPSATGLARCDRRWVATSATDEVSLALPANTSNP